MDTSEHETHGQQELAFYNGCYGSTCYLPRFLFASVPDAGDPAVVCAELPDHQGEQTEAILESLERVVATVRRRFPKVRLRLRADAGFADPDLYTWAGEPPGGLRDRSGHQRGVEAAGRTAVCRARRAAEKAPTLSATLYGSVQYQADSWEKQRRVLVKVTVTASGEKVRFVLCGA
jgi:hypothetical protein